ncbi:MAG: group II intron reverse transcriptase/maturase [Elusimicrobiota bacterium]
MQRQVIKDEGLQKVSWQSDQLVLSKKQSNSCGEKGLEKMREGTRETSAGLRTGEQMSTKLAPLTLRARRDSEYKFITLMNLFTEEYLLECFKELKKNKAPGIDGVEVEEYEADLARNIKDLCARLKAWKYKPKPALRVYIPKSDGTKRGLGIPAVEDKIVQVWAKKILEAIYEVDFCDVSYGFRPKRGCREALKALDKALMTKPVNYVVDMDIRKFFDSIDHEWMMRCLRQRITDTKFLRLMGRFLKAGVMEEGKLIDTEKGTPQGGNLSPILANIYLHYVLDLWFERKVKKKLKGYAQLTRYADDFVVCFEKSEEAEAFSKELVERLKKFGLEIAENKSRRIKFGRRALQEAEAKKKKVETFDFLGFTHYCDRTRNGKFKVGRKTTSKRFRQKMKAMNLWLKEIRNRVALQEWWKTLRQKLVRHYNYYGISGNFKGIARYYWETQKLAFKWINRRSQKRSYNWEQFGRYLHYNSLPKPKIYHSIYALSSR